MGKKSPFQVGVKVRIVTPERFVRCGYNLTPKIAARILKEQHEQDIIDFLEKLGIPNMAEVRFPYRNDDVPIKILRDHRVTDRLLGDLGYFYTGAKGMGGKERRIHTVPAPEYTGLEGFINESLSVVTGDHYGSSGGQDYDGEHWYEPGGLHDQQSHRIHCLSVYRPDLHSDDLQDAQFTGLWFEQRCLEVVE